MAGAQAPQGGAESRSFVCIVHPGMIVAGRGPR
jgi:hypothetical protein